MAERKLNQDNLTSGRGVKMSETNRDNNQIYSQDIEVKVKVQGINKLDVTHIEKLNKLIQ